MTGPEDTADTAVVPPATPANAAPTNPIELVRRNRARLEILLIGLVAVGGIVCMAIATLIVILKLAQQ